MLTIRAAYGAVGTYATATAPWWAPDACPDLVSEFNGQDGGHVLGEVKVYNSIVAAPSELMRGATRAFGATEAHLRSEILGARAADGGRRRFPPTVLHARPARWHAAGSEVRAGAHSAASIHTYVRWYPS